jgi:hypothetical protein
VHVYTPALQGAAVQLAEPDKSTPIMLDWEYDGTLRPDFNDVLAVAAELRKRGYRVPLLYTGKWYWEQMGRPTLSGHGFELVNSNYGNQSSTGTYEIKARYAALGGDASTRWNVSYGGLRPSVWQFGSRIHWGNRYMDMNAIRDPAVIERIWPKEPMPVPDPDPQPEPEGINVMLPMIGKYPNHGVWVYSLDGGVTHRKVHHPDQQADALVAGGAIYAKGKKVVTSWDTVADFASATEVAQYLGTLVS